MAIPNPPVDLSDCRQETPSAASLVFQAIPTVSLLQYRYFWSNYPSSLVWTSKRWVPWMVLRTGSLLIPRSNTPKTVCVRLNTPRPGHYLKEALTNVLDPANNILVLWHHDPRHQRLSLCLLARSQSWLACEALTQPLTHPWWVPTSLPVVTSANAVDAKGLLTVYDQAQLVRHHQTKNIL